MQDFFIKYPDIYLKCKEVNNYINASLEKYSIDDNEISIDHLIPFLFQEIPESIKLNLAIALRLGREIIDFYNNGNNEVLPFANILLRFYPLEFISFEEYQLLNKSARKFHSNDIVSSYISSTKRVFYRNEIIKYYSNKFNFHLSELFFKQVQILSAFFLYDDDICDFESDITNGKETILSDYVINHDGEIINSNKTFINKLDIIKMYNQNNNKLVHFLETFKTIYQ